MGVGVFSPFQMSKVFEKSRRGVMVAGAKKTSAAWMFPTDMFLEASSDDGARAGASLDSAKALPEWASH